MCAITVGREARLIRLPDLKPAKICPSNLNSHLAARLYSTSQQTSWLCQGRSGTTTKLGVSFYAYIHDRISEASQMPALDTVIVVRAKELNLATSWGTP